MSAESNMRIMLVCLLVIIAVRSATSLPTINTCQATPSYTLVNNTVNVSCNIEETDQTLNTYWISLNGTSDGSMLLGNPATYYVAGANFMSGGVYEVRFLDGNVSLIDRSSSGSPSMQIRANYTGVINPSTLHFTFYWNWSDCSPNCGNPWLAFYLFNYSSSGWVEIPCQGATATCAGSPSRFGFNNRFSWNNITVSNASDFVNAYGFVQIIIDSTFNGNNKMQLDYLHLTESTINGTYIITWYANQTGNFSVMGFLNDTAGGQSNNTAGYVVVSMDTTTTITTTSTTLPSTLTCVFYPNDIYAYDETETDYLWSMNVTTYMDSILETTDVNLIFDGNWTPSGWTVNNGTFTHEELLQTSQGFVGFHTINCSFVDVGDVITNATFYAPTTTTTIPIQISNCQVTPAVAVLGGMINVSALAIQHTNPLDQFWFTLNGSFVGEQTAENGTNVFEYPLMLLGTGNYSVVCFVNDTASLQNDTSTESVWFQIVTTTTSTTTSTTVTSTTVVVAVLVNTTVSPSVFLDDYVSGYTRLINTNDESLGSQDCVVTALLNDTDELVKVWDTSCKQGTQYLDLNNDFQYLSENCTLSDSQGFYYFTGKVTEADGFETGRYYKLVFSCNKKSAYGVFYVDVSKPWDVGKWFEFARRYLGLIVLYIVVLIMLLVLVGLVWKVVGRNLAIVLGIIILILLLWLR